MEQKVQKPNYKIKSDLLDVLYSYRDKLPNRSPGENGYNSPAGLAMLGANKNNIVDSSVLLKMTSGCFDLPGVSYRRMDEGFRQLISMDRIVCGMALIRHPDYSSEYSKNTLISNDLIRNIKDFKSSFYDITNTLWAVITDKCYRLYGVEERKKGGVTTVELDSMKFTLGKESKFMKLSRETINKYNKDNYSCDDDDSEEWDDEEEWYDD